MLSATFATLFIFFMISAFMTNAFHSRKGVDGSSSSFKLCGGAVLMDFKNAIIEGLPTKKLERWYGGCTHIQNHLIIMNQRGKVDLSFLSSIEEVYGVVVIMNNKVPVIPLSNLQIIHGDKFIRQLEKYSLIIHNVYPYVYQSTVDLRSLVSVRKRQIFLGIHQICYLNKVNWRVLLENADEQSVNMRYRLRKCPLSANKCDANCPMINGKQYCWGPGKTMCQKISYCNASICGDEQSCFIDSDGETRCCHEECEKGCSGPSESECFACRNFRFGNRCQNACSPVNDTEDDMEVITTVSPPQYELFDLCLSKCPSMFMIEEGKCVEKCSPNYYPLGDHCEPCENDTCDAICRMESLLEKVFEEKPQLREHYASQNYLFRSLTKKLRNCTIVFGDIVLNEKSYDFSVFDETIRDEDLENLKNIRIIKGYLSLFLIYSQHKSLYFLSNLESIRTPAPNKGLEIQFSLTLQYLGLKRLKYVNAQLVKIRGNYQLCYLENIKNRFPGVNVILRANGNIITCKGKKCSSDCVPSKGCWGPGREMCHEQRQQE